MNVQVNVSQPWRRAERPQPHTAGLRLCDRITVCIVLASSSPLLLSVDHQCLADKLRLFCVVLQFNSVRNCQSANAANRTTAAPDCKGSFYEMWIQWRPIAVLPTPWRSSFFFFSFFLLFSHFSFSVDYYTRELILMAWEMTDSSIYLSLVVTIEHQ